MKLILKSCEQWLTRMHKPLRLSGINWCQALCFFYSTRSSWGFPISWRRNLGSKFQIWRRLRRLSRCWKKETRSVFPQVASSCKERFCSKSKGIKYWRAGKRRLQEKWIRKLKEWPKISTLMSCSKQTNKKSWLLMRWRKKKEKLEHLLMLSARLIQMKSLLTRTVKTNIVYSIRQLKALQSFLNWATISKMLGWMVMPSGTVWSIRKSTRFWDRIPCLLRSIMK